MVAKEGATIPANLVVNVAVETASSLPVADPPPDDAGKHDSADDMQRSGYWFHAGQGSRQGPRSYLDT